MSLLKLVSSLLCGKIWSLSVCYYVVKRAVKSFLLKTTRVIALPSVSQKFRTILEQ
jgi:hypothetical protein